MTTTSDPRVAAEVNLLWLSKQARRCPRIVGSVEYPSEWDKAHVDIDAALDEMIGR